MFSNDDVFVVTEHNRLSLSSYLSLTVEFALCCECYQWRNIVESETRNSAFSEDLVTRLIFVIGTRHKHSRKSQTPNTYLLRMESLNK